MKKTLALLLMLALPLCALLLENGCIKDDTPFFLTHMAPHWTPPYDIYAPMMAEKGFIVAYDGMVAEI